MDCFSIDLIRWVLSKGNNQKEAPIKRLKFRNEFEVLGLQYFCS